MWYQINNWEETDHCIYKLWYSGKYLLVRCVTMFRSVQNLNTGLKYFFQNTPKGRNPNDLYYKFYCHVADSPFNQFKIEVVFKSDSHFELLKQEFMLLQAGKSDENCLNVKFEPYIPKFTQSNKQKAWLNRGSYLNFMDWKHRYELSQSKIE